MNENFFPKEVVMEIAFVVTILIVVVAAGVVWVDMCRGKARKAVQKVEAQKAVILPADPLDREAASIAAEVVDRLVPDPAARFKDRLRIRKAAGEALETAFASAVGDLALGEALGLDDALRVVAEMGYPAVEFASLAAKHGYAPREVAERLTRWCWPISANELADIVKPLVLAVPAAGADEDDAEVKTFNIVKDAVELDDNGDLAALAQHLFPPDNVSGAARLLYRESDMGFGEVIGKLFPEDAPEVVASLAKELEVDITDSDEYVGFRDGGDMSFDSMATILKAYGADAETVLRCENSYEELSDDDLKSIFETLSAAGYTASEILSGIRQAEIVCCENADGTIVQFAMETKIPTEDIVAFFKSEGIRLEDLDDELEDLDVNIKTRVDILYALLHGPAAEKTVSVEPEADAASGEDEHAGESV